MGEHSNTGFIDKLAWVHLAGGKVLCARSRGKTTFYVPGGKREPGESDTAALCREIQEELSVDLVPESIHLLGEFLAQADGKPVGVQVRLRCYTADFTGAFAPAAEIAEIAWLARAERPRCSLVTQIVFDWLAERGLLSE